jgi:hypothetical protein
MVPWRHVLLPLHDIAMPSCALAGGVTALLAVVRRRERSAPVWLGMLPGFFVLFSVLGEFLVPPFDQEDPSARARRPNRGARLPRTRITSYCVGLDRVPNRCL